MFGTVPRFWDAVPYCTRCSKKHEKYSPILAGSFKLTMSDVRQIKTLQLEFLLIYYVFDVTSIVSPHERKLQFRAIPNISQRFLIYIQYSRPFWV